MNERDIYVYVHVQAESMNEMYEWVNETSFILSDNG